MSNNEEENNNHFFLKNRSTQNLYLTSHQKNRSSTFLSDSPSTLISGQIKSLNDNKNSRSKDKNNLTHKYTEFLSPKNVNIKTTFNENQTEKIENRHIKYKYSNKIMNENESKTKTMKEKNNPTKEECSSKEKKNDKIKIGSVVGQYSACAPKQIISVYKGQEKIEPINMIKNNIYFGIQKKKIPENNEKKNVNENKNNCTQNDYVEYVNNDKYKFNGNILNITQNNNLSKYVLSQSKSFTKIEKKYSAIKCAAKDNNKNYNVNNKNNHNFNYVNYNNYKNNYNKKKELTVLTKNSNTHRNNKNENNNKINSFILENVSTSPNSNNNMQNYTNIDINNLKKNETSKDLNRIKNKSNGGNKAYNTNSNNNNKNNNNQGNKNILYMKCSQPRKKNSYEHKKESNNKRVSDSKNQKSYNYLDNSFYADVFNKNINNPEELHFFYVKILQNGNEISKKFEVNEK